MRHKNSSAITVTIALTDSPQAGVYEAMTGGLLSYNEAHAGARNYQALAVLVTELKTGRILGGVWAGTSFEYLHIDALYLPETLRGQGLGSELVTMAEKEAQRRRCHAVWLDTFSFQARGFYEKLGYSIFGMLEDYPPGHQRYFMTKSLRQAK
jgi:ribosomal protein S18 acetylase RimI-like enzyme